MFCPAALDYSNAIQNPQLNFRDPELQTGQPELTPFGLPRPWSGNFATVFQMHCNQVDWAVRCFTRELNDQQARYAVINHHLAMVKLPYTVPFDFIPKGIQINGKWYPILKMAWVNGELLDHFIVKHLHHPKVLRQLATYWLTMINQLESAQIAHGDLQHGNILIVKKQIKLVDYDAMFVPALGGQKSREIGHPNYQHPARCASDFGVHIDRFSAWLIYMSLVALMLNPNLWQLVGAGDEFILFNQADFVNPQDSLLLALLTTHEDPRLPLLAEIVEKLLSLPLSQIPPLASLAERLEPLLDLASNQIDYLNHYLDSQLRAELFEQLLPIQDQARTEITHSSAPAKPIKDQLSNSLELPKPLPTWSWLQESKSHLHATEQLVKEDASLEESVQWFQESAKQGHAEAQYTLAWMYVQGRGVPQDLKQAVRLFRQAALKGYAEAQYNLGWMYAQGEGVPQNLNQAAHWFIKAAWQGHTAARQAQLNLYIKAAEQGDAQAQYRLWFMSTQGEQGIAQPLPWLEKAAQQGYMPAQYQLGMIYEQGDEVDRDLFQARYWYGKAVKQGSFLAAKRYFKLWILRYQDIIENIFIFLLFLGIILIVLKYYSHFFSS